MADFSFAIDKAKLAESVKDSLTLQTLTQEQMEQECFTIHKKVKQGLPNNVEILFTKGVQFFEKGRYPLGDTVIKFQVTDSDSPCYFYLKAGETLDAGVFIGGDSSAGFLLLKDAAGRDFFIKLTEFHLLSVRGQRI